MKIISVAIVLLMVVSALAVLASSGWTPQGNTESQEVYIASPLKITSIIYIDGTQKAVKDTFVTIPRMVS